MSEEIPVVLQVLTWGFNRTPVPQANLAVDIRWMPNPRHLPEFHDLSGLDAPVQEWVFAQDGAAVWFDALLDVLGRWSQPLRPEGIPW
ncbi:RapZ C-terminal domain-containing protein [Saccharopolyspora shandongensis]|uniref:RapZ C-terminal domain-containing protein n=1 Tax=Saccharopolyspora shandongensis TaxID=418495 RepID=UPI0033DE8CD4